MRRRGGFSLLELMAVLLLMALAMLAGATVSGVARGQASVKGVALRLLSDIRMARARAQASGELTGILLPAGSVSGSYAIVSASGTLRPTLQVLRLVDWTRETPGTVLAVGTWQGLPFTDSALSWLDSLRTEAGSVLALRGLASEYGGRFLMFTPSGSMITANLPLAQDEALLVVCAAAEGEGELTQVREDARTVCVSRLGTARVVPGVPGLANLQPRGAGSPGSNLSSLPAGLPRPLLGSVSGGASFAPPRENRAPEITRAGLTGVPTPGPAMLPSGAVAGKTFLLKPGGTLSLSVRASDPDGDALFVTWGSEAVAASGSAAPSPKADGALTGSGTVAQSGARMSVTEGAFSVQVVQPMRSLEDGSGEAEAVAEWTAPEGAVDGDWFALGVVVEDLKGGRASTWIVVTMASSRDALVYYSAPPTANSRYEEFRVFANEVRPRRSRLPASDPAADSPAWTSRVSYSPDGKNLLTGYGKQVAVRGQDGTVLWTGTLGHQSWLCWPSARNCWSGDGTLWVSVGLGYIPGKGWNNGLWVYQAPATLLSSYVPSSRGGSAPDMPAISPDGSRVAWVEGGNLRCAPSRDLSLVRTLASDASGSAYGVCLSWSHTGGEIAYKAGVGSKHWIRAANPTSGAVRDLSFPATGQKDSHPSFSPVDDRIAFLRYDFAIRGHDVVVRDASGQERTYARRATLNQTATDRGVLNWSSDGKYLSVYGRTVQGSSATSTVVVVRLEDGAETNVETGEELPPEIYQWIPVGAR